MRPVIICAGGPDGGGKARRGTSLAAPSAAASAISNFRHAGRASAICGADVFSRAEGFGGRQATTGHRSPINSLGLGRAFQPLQKPARAFANTLHLPNSLQTASASYEQEIIGAAHELGWIDQERGFFSQGGTDG